MKTTTNVSEISISVDGVWAGSGRVVDGYIVDCGAVLAGGQDESDDVYDLIEEAIGEGLDHQIIEHADGTTHRYAWTITQDEIIRYSADGSVSMVYRDGEPVRCPTQEDMDTLPVGPDMTDDDIESLAD